MFNTSKWLHPGVSLSFPLVTCVFTPSGEISVFLSTALTGTNVPVQESANVVCIEESKNLNFCYLAEVTTLFLYSAIPTHQVKK